MKVILGGILLFGCLNGYSQKSFTVYFDFAKHTLSEPGRKQLDSFLLAEKENLSRYTVSLDGYCDFIGTDNFNSRLSENRVSVVKNYLVDHGVAAVNIKHKKGHGENDPLNENKTAEERQLNRRVSITLVVPMELTREGSRETAPDKKSLTETIADTANRAGTSIVLKNMNFYGGSPFLLPESFPVLDELFEIMRVNHNLVIEIQGHICCIASPGDSPYGGTGNGLSEERARMIYAELIGKGIAADRVSYRGFGHSMPIYPFPERNEEERSANRRVEIKIIKR